jgi:hypothetical protein
MAEASFESYIKTVESHDVKVERAAGRGKEVESKRRAITPDAYELGDGFEGEEELKKLKVDEGDFPWCTGGRFV